MIAILLPMLLILGRIGAFLAVLPLFSWHALPMRVRAGLAIVLTFFMSKLSPPAVLPAGPMHVFASGLMMTREILCGLALGLAVRVLYAAAEQGGRFASRQMGFAMAQAVNPLSGDSAETMGTFFDISFSLFFLVLNGHHLLIALMARSYEVFPIGAPPDTAQMALALVDAGSLMLVFALRMAAPLVAAFILITVMLGVIARALPEMNILMISFPIRIGLGFLMAAALVPYLGAFTYELANEIGTFLG
ncbi:MAG: flagellar biosynthetic protein FliR [Planctomycetota bacterium]